MPLSTSRTVCDLYFIVHFIFHIANCLLCILYRLFLLYPRPTAHFYMCICRILLIQLLGCHIEINAVCLVLSSDSESDKHNIELLYIDHFPRRAGPSTYINVLLGSRRPALTSG